MVTVMLQNKVIQNINITSIKKNHTFYWFLKLRHHIFVQNTEKGYRISWTSIYLNLC